MTDPLMSLAFVTLLSIIAVILTTTSEIIRLEKRIKKLEDKPRVLATLMRT